VKYVECPNDYRKAPGEKSLFPAGGITTCPDWQALMVDLLTTTDLALLNPRRKAFDVNNATVEEQQIRWEFQHMNRATAVLFWFCAETVCPTHHAAYQRRKDLHIQTKLVRKRQKIHDSLEALAAEVKAWARRRS
jgi:hypothetical protein